MFINLRDESVGVTPLPPPPHPPLLIQNLQQNHHVVSIRISLFTLCRTNEKDDPANIVVLLDKKCSLYDGMNFKQRFANKGV